MREKKFIAKLLSGVFLSMSLIGMATPAQALVLEDYAHMSAKEQGAYTAKMLGAAVHLLQQQGRAEDARKIMNVFGEDCQPNPQRSSYCQPGKQISKGTDQFLNDLDAAWAANAKLKEQGKPSLEVEQAFLVTLKRLGVADIKKDDFMTSVRQENTVVTAENRTQRPIIK